MMSPFFLSAVLSRCTTTAYRRKKPGFLKKPGFWGVVISEIDFESGTLILHGTQEAAWTIKRRHESPRRI